jgi:signal transduction histidine kinase
MLNIINNIVSISQIESGQMNLSYKKLQLKVRWNLFITISKLRKNIKLKINITLSEIDNLIRTDEEKVSYIITFASNAIKFTNYGVIEIGCFKSNNAITFMLKILGIGIDAKKIDVFERFRQPMIH